MKPRKNPKLKVVVFSNYDSQSEVDEAFKYGASKYVLKAWSSPTELKRIVKEVLEN